MATSLHINILDNGGRVDVSLFSERLMLDSDMLGYGTRKASKLANDGTFADRRP